MATADELLAQLDAHIDALEADDQADAALIATLKAERDAARSDDAADDATIAQLRARLAELEGGSTPPPPPTATLSATHKGSGNVEIAWPKDIFIPIVLGRSGRDRSGYPAAPRDGWTTNDDGFGGVSAAIRTAGKFVFTAMDTGREHVYFAADALGRQIEAKLTVAAPTSPPTSPPSTSTGTLNFGVFRHGDTSHAARVSQWIDYPVRTFGYFVHMLDNGVGLLDPWAPLVKASPAHTLDLCLQPVTWDGKWPGFNGGAAWLVDSCRQWARKLVQLGIDAQTIVRLFGEVNADWFIWGGNPEWYRYVANLCIDAIKAESPRIRVFLNFVPGTAGSPHPVPGASADPEFFWIDKFDGYSLDHYFWVLSGSTSEEKAGAYFSHSRSDIWVAQKAKEKGKQWCISEGAACNLNTPNKNGSGDDGRMVRLVFEALDGRRDALPGQRIVQKPLFFLYEDVPDGNVNSTLEQNPNVIRELRAFYDTVPA